MPAQCGVVSIDIDTASCWPATMELSSLHASSSLIIPQHSQQSYLPNNNRGWGGTIEVCVCVCVYVCVLA